MACPPDQSLGILQTGHARADRQTQVYSYNSVRVSALPTGIIALNAFSFSALQNGIDLVADHSEPRTNPNNPNASGWQGAHQEFDRRARPVLTQPSPKSCDRSTVVWVIRNVKPLIHLQGGKSLSVSSQCPRAGLLPGAQDDMARRNAQLLATATIDREPWSQPTLRAQDLPASAVGQRRSRY